MTERELPRDAPAERAALGGMLLSPDAIAEVSEILRPADFYEPRHEHVYTAILDLYATGQPADAVTVADLLHGRGELAKAGGPGYLHELMEAVPTAANAGYYAEIVLAKAQLRGLINFGTRCVQRGYETDDSDIGSIIDKAQADAYALSRVTDAAEGVSQFESVDRVLTMFEKGTDPGLPTGFRDLDALTGGLKRGKFIVVAGRPGMGKSTLGLDIVRHTSIRHGQPSAIFSLEMGRDELTQRQLAAQARVSLYRMEHQQLTDADWERLRDHADDVSGAPIHVDDSPDLTMMRIRTKARRMHQRHNLKLILIDYLQLMGAGGGRKPENRQQEVSEISRGLKLLAKELDIPVIAIAQLNRGPEQREDKRPVLSDLRESGALEQDADLVILIHREEVYNAESPRAGEADLIVAKNRSGPRGEIVVSFQGHYARFMDMGHA